MIPGLPDLTAFNTLNTFKEVKIKQKITSSLKNITKLGLLLTGVGITAQSIYNINYTPSRFDHPLSSLSQDWEFSNLETSKEISAFKTAQVFFNIFETKSSLYHFLGFASDEPFGELQAFALDGDLKSLERAYHDYTDNQVTTRMKNRLLGQVLRLMDQSQKNLTHIIKWLLKIGANVNYQEKKTFLEQQKSKPKAYTTLLTAFKNLDFDFYKYLLSKGANPALQIQTYPAFIGTQSILDTIITEANAQLKSSYSNIELEEEHLCPIYKKIIDSSLPNFSSKEESARFRVKTYLEKINPYFCKNYFLCTEQEEIDYESDKLVHHFNNWARNLKDLQQSINTTVQFTTHAASTLASATIYTAQKSVNITIDVINSDATANAKNTLIQTTHVLGSAISTLASLTVDTAKKTAILAIDAINSNATTNGKNALIQSIYVLGNAISTLGSATVYTAQRSAEITIDAINSKATSDAKNTLIQTTYALGNAVSTLASATVYTAQRSAEMAIDAINSKATSDAKATLIQTTYLLGSAMSALAKVILYVIQKLIEIIAHITSTLASAAIYAIPKSAEIAIDAINSKATSDAKNTLIQTTYALGNAVSTLASTTVYTAQRSAEIAIDAINSKATSDAKDTLIQTTYLLGSAASTLASATVYTAQRSAEIAIDALNSKATSDAKDNLTQTIYILGNNIAALARATLYIAQKTAEITAYTTSTLANAALYTIQKTAEITVYTVQKSIEIAIDVIKSKATTTAADVLSQTTYALVDTTYSLTKAIIDLATELIVDNSESNELLLKV